jgi:hypothetical protein
MMIGQIFLLLVHISCLVMYVSLYIFFFHFLGRNALLVIVSALLVFGLSLHGIEPFTVTGYLKPGLPPVKPPAFSVVDHGVNGTGNGTTYTASDIFSVSTVPVWFRYSELCGLLWTAVSVVSNGTIMPDIPVSSV